LRCEIKLSEGLRREIEVEIPAETVDSAFAEMYDKYRKEVKVKGFRPGKVPMNIVKSKFQDEIHHDIIEELIEKSYPEAIKEQKLKVASLPDFSDYNLKEGSSFKYTAKLEVLPEVENVDYEGLVLPKEEIRIEDSEVNDVIQYLREKKAEIRPISRAAAEQDVLLVDLIKTDDPDNAIDLSEFKDFELDLSSRMTVKEFKEVLKGASAGEEREVKVEYPRDFSNEKLAGKTVKFLAKVKEVRERIIPAESDAFAKSMGRGETMLEMRLKVREDLKRQREHDRMHWEKDEIMRQVLEKNQIPIPETFITRYLDAVVEDMKKGKDPFDEKEVRENYRPVAINAIRWDFLMDRLIELEKIEVLPSDTENWIKGFAEAYKMDVPKAKEVLTQSGKTKEIRDKILDNKVFDFLMSKVKYVEATADLKVSAGVKDGEKENNITEGK